MNNKLTIGNATIYAGNNLEVLPMLADNSVDSIVCDPPYELGFMGKTWDASGIAYSVELWRECLRVLKPGGHLLAFGGTRTWHRLAVAIEDAGFEIRDNIAWLYGSGFPKSHNISLGIDKKLGLQGDRGSAINVGGKGERKDIETSVSAANGKLQEAYKEYKSDEAKAWDGWGTALKPAHEPIVVARKPVQGTVAENVLKHGTGAINIDATRIAGKIQSVPMAEWTQSGTTGASAKRSGEMSQPSLFGRWPANIILDEYTAELLDQQSGILTSGELKAGRRVADVNINFKSGSTTDNYVSKSNQGGASRFFYVAKANKRDRNEGLDELPIQRPDLRTSTGMGTFEEKGVQPQRNFHPTVKPTALMQYLIRLVTPENGIVLDPFCGSGSTGKAAILENKHFIGIELTPEYLPIIAGRLQHATETVNSKEDDLFE